MVLIEKKKIYKINKILRGRKAEQEKTNKINRNQKTITK